MKRGAIFLYLAVALLTISLASAQADCFINTSCSVPGLNLITNGDFESGAVGSVPPSWAERSTGNADLRTINPGYSSSKGAYFDSFTASSPDLAIYQTGITLESTTQYKLSFDAYSSGSDDLDVNLTDNTRTTDYGINEVTFDLSNGWQNFEYIFTTPDFGGTVNNGLLLFSMEPYSFVGENYYFDNVILEEITGITYSSYGYISTQGHYSDTLSVTADYPYKLCCPDVWASGTGNTSFKFSEYTPPLINGSNHVSTIYSATTTFTGEVQLGTDYCVNRASCAAGESCIFKMSNPDNAHIADCNTADHPIPNSFGGELCCLVSEVCWDGLDNDLDGFTDCADSDCFGGRFGTNPDRPQECTGSPQNTTFCAPAYNYTSGQTIFNDECLGEVPPGNTHYYCAYGLSDDADIDPVGVCCPYETYPHLVAGQWVCDDEISPGVLLEECGITGGKDCRDDFDTSLPDFYPPNPPNWLSEKYTNDPDDWCNTQISNTYIDPVVAPYAGSTGCCLIQKFGEYDYYLDEENIKIWG